MNRNTAVQTKLLPNGLRLFACLCALHCDGTVASPPVIDRFERDGNSVRFHFTGQPLYDYTVEFTDSLTSTNWSALASYRAKVVAIDAVVTHSLTNAQLRFFRVRQEPCYCR